MENAYTNFVMRKNVADNIWIKQRDSSDNDSELSSENDSLKFRQRH